MPQGLKTVANEEDKVEGGQTKSARSHGCLRKGACGLGDAAESVGSRRGARQLSAGLFVAKFQSRYVVPLEKKVWGPS